MLSSARALALATFCSGVVLAADASAGATTPSRAAQAQIATAIDQCVRGLSPASSARGPYEGFKASRDAAVKIDATIVSWNGTVQTVQGGRVVSEWVPRCERELSVRADAEVKAEAINDAFFRFDMACDNALGAPSTATQQLYVQAREALYALTDAKPAALEPLEGAATKVTKCEREVPAALDAAQKAPASGAGRATAKKRGRKSARR